MSKLLSIVLALYFATFIALALLLLLGTQLSPTAQATVMSIAGEGMKIVLSAFVGAMSALIGAKK